MCYCQFLSHFNYFFILTCHNDVADNYAISKIDYILYVYVCISLSRNNVLSFEIQLQNRSAREQIDISAKADIVIIININKKML